MEEITLKELYEKSDSAKLPLNELFDVKCRKCNSSNVTLGGDGDADVEEPGCESCGHGGYASWRFWLALKCLDCGNAKIIFKEK